MGKQTKIIFLIIYSYDVFVEYSNYVLIMIAFSLPTKAFVYFIIFIPL